MKVVLTVSMIVERPSSHEIDRFIAALETEGVKQVSVVSCAPIPSSVDIEGLNLNQNFVIFSVSEWMRDANGDGFWSNEYGWVYCDLATRFTLDEVGAFGSSLPGACGSDAVFMADPVPTAQYPYAMKVRKAGSEPSDPWIDFVCFALNVDDAFLKALTAYQGARIYAYEDMKLDMEAAASDPYDPKDFAAHAKKYELMKTARINVPSDFDCRPFLPGQMVAIKFCFLAKATPSALPCPVYAIAGSCEALETTTTRYFANALSSFAL